MKTEITKIVEEGIDALFCEAHSKANTKSGDITPSQEFRLDKIKEDLIKLMIEQVEQNQ